MARHKGTELLTRPLPGFLLGPHRVKHLIHREDAVAVAVSFYEFATGASQTRMGCPYSRDSVRD